MLLRAVEIVDNVTAEDFQKKYLAQGIPVVIKNLAASWPAYHKWTWDYFKSIVGEKKVGIYNNTKSDAYTPINKADGYTSFGEYIDMISTTREPVAWRIFLFNIFKHAPQLTKDFTWPRHLMHPFVKTAPMLFIGGKGSITHMHFDIDLSHIIHTQFAGRKRVLLFPYKEQYKLYRKPFEVLSMADFSHYYDSDKTKLDTLQFPAVQFAQGFEVILEHGDTLFMPGGYWHHMEYIDSGFAMSLRALNFSVNGALKGVWNLAGMRGIDTLLKKTIPVPWFEWKKKKLFERAAKVAGK